MNEEIRSLKEKLYYLEKAHKDGDQVKAARDALGIEIELLKEEVDDLRIRGINPEAKLQLLEVCRTKYRSLDHRIDEIEDVSEDSLQVLREKLIGMILSTHPGQKETYQELTTRFQTYRQLSLALSEIEEKLGEIVTGLGEAQKAVRKVKTYWVLSYVFGANPNAVIGKCLEICSKNSIQILALLENRIELTPEEDALFFEELRNDLEEFEPECRKQWSFQKINHSFQQYKERFRALIDGTQHLQISLKNRIVEDEQELDRWIEAHS